MLKGFKTMLKNATYEGEDNNKIIFKGEYKGYLQLLKLTKNLLADEQTQTQIKHLKNTLTQNNKKINIYKNNSIYKFIIKEGE